MGWLDILLLALVAFAVAAAVYTRRHHGGCGCDCSRCHGCSQQKTEK